MANQGDDNLPSLDELRTDFVWLAQAARDGKLTAEQREELRYCIEECRDLIEINREEFRQRQRLGPNISYVDQDLEPLLVGFLLLEGSQTSKTEARSMVDRYFTAGVPKFMAKPLIEWIAMGLAYELPLLKDPTTRRYHFEYFIGLDKRTFDNLSGRIDRIDSGQFMLRDEWAEVLVDLIKSKAGDTRGELPGTPGNHRRRRDNGNDPEAGP